MKIVDIEQSREQIRRFARALLTSRGVHIDGRGFFKCPAHDESEASAHFIPGTDETRWFCLGCQCGGDIFDLAHHTDGLPQSGPGWIRETLPKLAAEFNVELHYEGKEMTTEEQQEFEAYQAYDRAARLVGSMPRSGQVQDKIAAYGWTPRTLRVFGIGSVPSCDKFVKALVKMGYTKDFLDKIGLTDFRIFRPECLIFTIKDAAGRPIGFSSRYLDFEQEDKKLQAVKQEKGADSPEFKDARKKLQPKYVNTGSKNPIYKKGDVLFGLHSARNSSKTLYVFEGNADLVTAYNGGLVNSAAVCGAAFTESHFDEAIGLGFNHFVFVMDGDKGGEGASRRVVDLCGLYLADKPQVRADLIDLPVPEGEKKVDPDSFLREHGLAAFRKLPAHSFRYWNWRDRLTGSDRITVTGEAAKQIAEQPDPLLRWDLLSSLHELTGIGMEFLWDTVVRQAAHTDTDVARQIVASASWMQLFHEDIQAARKAATTTEEFHKMEPPEVCPLVATSWVPMAPEKEAAQEASRSEVNEQAAANWK